MEGDGIAILLICSRNPLIRLVQGIGFLFQKSNPGLRRKPMIAQK